MLPLIYLMKHVPELVEHLDVNLLWWICLFSTLKYMYLNLPSYFPCALLVYFQIHSSDVQNVLSKPTFFPLRSWSSLSLFCLFPILSSGPLVIWCFKKNCYYYCKFSSTLMFFPTCLNCFTGTTEWSQLFLYFR